MSSTGDTPARPRGRPRDEALAGRRREQILDAATTVFARHGYRRADVQEIADEVGVGKGTVYRYFSGKAELFLAAVDRGIVELIERLRASMEDTDDAIERIRRGVATYLEYFELHPELPELFIQERAEFRHHRLPLYFQHQESEEEWLEEIRGVVEAGRLRKIRPETILDVMGDLLYGVMLTNHLSGRSKPLASQVHEILDIAFYGILSPEERERRPPEPDPSTEACDRDATTKR